MSVLECQLQTFNQSTNMSLNSFSSRRTGVGLFDSLLFPQSLALLLTHSRFAQWVNW